MIIKRKLTKKQYKEKEKKTDAKKQQFELLLPKIPKLSPKLIKSLHNYINDDECGLKIEAKYVNGNLPPYTEEQELDNYFKYLCKNVYVDSSKATGLGIVKNTGKFTLPYERLTQQYNNFAKTMSFYNWEIENSQFEFTNPKYSGKADIIALDKNIKSKDKNKQRIIIDIKTSGLINDKLSPYGWANETIQEKWDL